MSSGSILDYICSGLGWTFKTEPVPSSSPLNFFVILFSVTSYELWDCERRNGKAFHEDSETGQYLSELKPPHTSDRKAGAKPKQFLI